MPTKAVIHESDAISAVGPACQCPAARGYDRTGAAARGRGFVCQTPSLPPCGGRRMGRKIRRFHVAPFSYPPCPRVLGGISQRNKELRWGAPRRVSSPRHPAPLVWSRRLASPQSRCSVVTNRRDCGPPPLRSGLPFARSRELQGPLASAALRPRQGGPAASATRGLVAVHRRGA